MPDISTNRNMTDDRLKDSDEKQHFSLCFVLTMWNTTKEEWKNVKRTVTLGGLLFKWRSPSQCPTGLPLQTTFVLSHPRRQMLRPGQWPATTADASQQLHRQRDKQKNPTSGWRNRRNGITNLAAIFRMHLKSLGRPAIGSVHQL